MPIAGLRLLDNPLVWNASRISLDLAFGPCPASALRADAGMEAAGWRSTSVIDIGCGVGHYAHRGGGGNI